MAYCAAHKGRETTRQGMALWEQRCKCRGRRALGMAGVLPPRKGKTNSMLGSGVMGAAPQTSWPTSTGHGGHAAPPQGEEKQHTGAWRCGSSAANVVADEHWVGPQQNAGLLWQRK